MLEKDSMDGLRFIELSAKARQMKELENSEESELLNLVKLAGGAVEIEGDKKCYWVCKAQGWACNPENPPPKCDCVKVCL